MGENGKAFFLLEITPNLSWKLVLYFRGANPQAGAGVSWFSRFPSNAGQQAAEFPPQQWWPHLFPPSPSAKFKGPSSWLVEKTWPDDQLKGPLNHKGRGTLVTADTTPACKGGHQARLNSKWRICTLLYPDKMVTMHISRVKGTAHSQYTGLDTYSFQKLT